MSSPTSISCHCPLANSGASLTAVRKLIAEHNPQLTVDEVEFELNRVLKDLISHDTIARLSRSKERQIEGNGHESVARLSRTKDKQIEPL
jgi:hypothetical protein